MARYQVGVCCDTWIAFNADGRLVGLVIHGVIAVNFLLSYRNSLHNLVALTLGARVRNVMFSYVAVGMVGIGKVVVVVQSLAVDMPGLVLFVPQLLLGPVRGVL